MAFPNIITDIQEKVNLSDLINLIYPVGSIYMSVNNVSPETFLGGTWEQIQDTFLLCAGNSHLAGETGGEETHTLTTAETPAHTHTRGTMEITGSYNVYWSTVNSLSGAFYGSSATSNGSNQGGGSGNYFDGVNFKASNTWTGETSSVGSSQSHNNMPPYLAVYCWKRIS